jgi:hypothetical protein
MLKSSSAQWCGDGPCEGVHSTTSTLDTVAIWCKGGVIVSPSALGEWGVAVFGLGRSTADGGRLGVGANFIMKNGNQASHGFGSRRRSVWGAHLNYDALFGGSQGLQFYSHFEFGFLVEVSGSREEQGNEVRPAFTTGLGLEYSGEVASKRLRLGPELGYHWAISSPYVIFQFGVDA